MDGVIFHPDVIQEVKAAFNWYEEQAQGLGDDLIAELEHAFLHIQQSPQTWPKFHRSSQRYLLPRFPFSVIYQQKSFGLYVLAVMHQHRKPGYWIKRIKS
jgi:toxin ParE1/3/4